MQYVRLERANIEVSRIAFGTQRFEDPEHLEKHVQTLLHAYAKGINFFDTAEQYVDGQAESILGAAVKEMKKGDLPFYISSRCVDGEEKSIREKLERSLRQLNLDRIDFYTCFWGIKSDLDWEQAKRYKTLEVLEKLKDEGLINHISITTHMKNDHLQKVITDYPFAINIVGYNLINSGFRRAGLKASYESGAANITMNPLGTGIIPQHADLFEPIRIKENRTAIQTAYDFLLSDPYIHVILGGFSTIDQVDSIVDTLDQHPKYTEKELDLIQERLRQSIERTPLEKRYEIAYDLTKKMYILRDEVSILMNVYPIKIRP